MPVVEDLSLDVTALNLGEVACMEIPLNSKTLPEPLACTQYQGTKYLCDHPSGSRSFTSQHLKSKKGWSVIHLIDRNSADACFYDTENENLHLQYHEDSHEVIVKNKDTTAMILSRIGSAFDPKHPPTNVVSSVNEKTRTFTLKDKETGKLLFYRRFRHEEPLPMNGQLIAVSDTVTVCSKKSLSYSVSKEATRTHTQRVEL